MDGVAYQPEFVIGPFLDQHVRMIGRLLHQHEIGQSGDQALLYVAPIGHAEVGFAIGSISVGMRQRQRIVEARLCLMSQSPRIFRWGNAQACTATARKAMTVDQG